MKSISDIITEQLTECQKSIVANHIAAGQVASGRTSGMFEVKNVSMSGGQLWGWKYMGVWETGRKKGGVPPHVPILMWVLNKLGLQGTEANSMAWAIQYKIAREGSSLHRSGGRKDIFTPPIEKLFNDLPNALGDLLIETIVQKWQ